MMKTAFFVSCIASTIQALKLETSTSALADLLAEMSVNKNYGSCMVAADRAKVGQENLNDMRRSRGKYKDPAFPRDLNAIYWRGWEQPDEGGLPKDDALATMEWHRLSEKYPDGSMFGTENIRPADIKQGSVGNCWFLSAAASIAEHPGRMEKIFATELDTKGGHAVNMFTLGVPSTVVIDDYIPFINDKPMGARMTDDGSIWPMVLEKAFAKMRGNYNHISGGQPSKGVRYLRGGPIIGEKTKYMTVDEIWEFVTEHLGNGDLVTAGTQAGKDTDTDKWGMVLGHAYTVAGFKQLSNGDKLIKARNPWGRDSYRGDYGAESKLWTKQLLREVPDAKDDEDGYVYMPVKQFKVSFSRIDANYNAERMKMDYHLKINDPSNGNDRGDPDLMKAKNGCGYDCKLASVTVVSTVAQKVWVNINTWSDDTMNDGCTNPGKGKFHSVFPTPQGARIRMRGHTGGEIMQGPFAFDRDTYQTFKIGLSLGGQRPKDWSVVAWGEHGHVYVYNDDGSDSDHWAMSDHMKSIPPRRKPVLDLNRLKPIKVPNQADPPQKREVPDPYIPPPPPYNPMPAYNKWVKTVSGEGYKYTGKQIKGYISEVAQNNFSVKDNKKVTVKRSVPQDWWLRIPPEHMYAAGGFDKNSYKKYADPDPSRMQIVFDLMPGEQFGWVLPKKATAFTSDAGASLSAADPERAAADKDAAAKGQIQDWIDGRNSNAPEPNRFVTSSGSLGPYFMRIMKNQNSGGNVGIVAEFAMFKKDWDNKLIYHMENISESEISVTPDRANPGKQIRVAFTLRPGQEVGWAMKNGQDMQVKLQATRL